MHELKAQGFSYGEIAKKFGILQESCKYRLDPDFAKKKNKQNKIYRDTHKEQIAADKIKHYQENSEYYKEYRVWYWKKNRESLMPKNRKYQARPENKTRARELQHKRKTTKTEELKQKIAYVNNRPVECFGYPSYGSCSPDGTPETRVERLEFDHIHGGGRKDRTGSTGQNQGKLQWLRNQLKLSDYKLKEKLQLLCSGCNQEKIRVEQRKKTTDL